MHGERLITVVVPQGRGRPLLELLYERHVLRAALGSARAPATFTQGTGVFARTRRTSLEKDVLQVVVSAEEADEIFHLLLEKGQIAEMPGGFQYMGSVSRTTLFALEGPGSA